jgi:hypothetical protein
MGTWRSAKTLLLWTALLTAGALPLVAPVNAMAIAHLPPPPPPPLDPNPPPPTPPPPTASPEPATLVTGLVGAGIASLAGWRYRRRKHGMA